MITADFLRQSSSSSITHLLSALVFLQGKVVYANYGRREDLEHLQSAGINLTKNIALVRDGELSLAEKVPQISLPQR